MADQRSATPGELTIMAAGAVMIIFSFTSFAGSSNAWHRGLFPIATLLPIYGFLMGLQIALTRFVSVKFPASVLGFTWEQIHLAVGVMAALMAFAWMSTDYGDKKVGTWFEIIGGIALLVGAALLQRERNTGAIG
jgi:hypothetical protein